MKLYKISQTVNNGYDTYSDAIVAAEDEEQARTTYPDKDYVYRDGKLYLRFGDGSEAVVSSAATFEWAPLEDVQVEYIGEAAPNLQAGVICSSFHAG